MDPTTGACLNWARAARWVAAIFLASALIGCGAARSRAQFGHGPPPAVVPPPVPAVPAAPARPAVPARPAPPDPVAPGRLAAATPRPRRAPRRRAAVPRPAPHHHAPPSRRARRATWLIDPDEPLPRDSRWWPVLAVARRFAVADMSYEVGRLGPAVWRTVTRTCTPAFAAELFSHRPSLPPGVRADQVLQRVVGVTALERLSHEAVVLVTVRSVREGRARGLPPGAFELPLVPRAGSWHVAGINVV